MPQHTHQVPSGVVAGRAFACPRCGAHLRIVRRRVVRRPRAEGVPARPALPARAPAPPGRRLPGGGVWWGALALLVLALVVGEVFAAQVPPAVPAGEPARGIAYTVERRAVASYVTAGAGASLALNASGQVTALTLRGKKTTDGVLRAQVALKDSKGNTLSTGSALLPPDSGEFALTVGLEPATVPYSRVAEVAVAYTR